MALTQARKTALEIASRRFLEESVRLQAHRLWPDASPDHLGMLDIEKLCQAAGLAYDEADGFPTTFANRGKQFQVIGLLDTQRHLVLVDSNLPLAIKRFTAAHELAHYLLHAQRKGYIPHRERPISEEERARQDRCVLEQEADYFASCLLIPRKLLQRHFEQIFGDISRPMVINEHVAHQICPSAPHSMFESAICRAIAVAGYRNVQMGRKHSLADTFKVSKQAMGWRLLELGYVDWP